MTLAGLSLAIGPMVDSAIICLENTHRHLGLGATPEEAAFLGASEVAMPELVASFCTLLVLAPLALMPGLGEFLFRPMAMAVAFAMISAYLLSRTFVPALGSLLAQAARSRRHDPHLGRGRARHRSEHENPQSQGLLRPRAFARWEAADRIAAFAGYVHLLDGRHAPPRRWSSARPSCCWSRSSWASARSCAASSSPRSTPAPSRSTSGPPAARGSRRPRSGSPRSRSSSARRSATTCRLIISELGVVADWSAAYTPNAGPMDAVVKVQLKHEREHSAQEYVAAAPRRASPGDPSSATWNSPSTPAA